MQAKRIRWRELKQPEQEKHLVFLDESSVNIDLTRRYGRGIGKKRVHAHAPLNTPRSQTILASMRLNGHITNTMYAGGTTGARFVDYLKDVLIPTLNKGDNVIMDNMRSHHVMGVEEMFCAFFSLDFGILHLLPPPRVPPFPTPSTALVLWIHLTSYGKSYFKHAS